MGLLSWLGLGRGVGTPPEKQVHADLADGAQKQTTSFDLSLLLQELANDIQLDDAHVGTRVLFDIDQSVVSAVIGDHGALKQAIDQLVKYCVVQTPQGYVALTVRSTFPNAQSASIHFKIEGSQKDWENSLSSDVETNRHTYSEGHQDNLLRTARTALSRLGVELETFGLDGKSKSLLLQFRYNCNRQPPASSSALAKNPALAVRVLIIEPDDFSRKIFKRMVDGLGCKTITAVSLIEANQHLAESLSPGGGDSWVLMCHHDLFSTKPAADWQALAETLQTSTAKHGQIHFLAFLNRPQGSQTTPLSTPTTPAWPVHHLSLPSTPVQLSDILGAFVATGKVAAVDTPIDAPPLSNLRLLVVEDDPINQFLALTLLEGEGASVQVAGDGRQCLDLLDPALTRFDAVLMDLEMPVLGGMETCKRIRSEPALASLPLIAVTGHDLDATRTDCLGAGFDECLTKPLDVQTLKETVLRVIRKYRIRAPKELPQKQPTPDTGSKAILDVDLAVSRMGGDAQIFMALVPQFPQHATELLEQAKANLVAGDFKSCARSLHSLKSVSGTMGAIELMQASMKAEQIVLEDGSLDVDCQSALSEVSKVLAKTQEALARLEQT